MPEQLTEKEEPKVEPIASDPFSEESWASDAPEVKAEEVKPVEVEVKKEEPAATIPATEEKKEDDFQTFDENEYVKNRFGWESPDMGKKELEELRKVKDAFKFNNEDSQKLYEYLQSGNEDEVYNFLDKKRKLTSAAGMPAADVIKLQIAQANPHYSSQDIQDVYEDRYDFPTKPEQAVEEDDDDYKERVGQWEARVAKVTRSIERDAIAAKQELAKHSIDLVLPSIKKEEEAKPKEPTQEELEAHKKQVDDFHKAVDTTVTGFEGFSVSVKDEGLDLPVQYALSPEEKTNVSNQLKAFANEGFNANALLADRWVSKDGTINVPQITRDLSLLQSGDKMFQKFVNDAASKRLEQYIKSKANIDIDLNKNKGTFKPDGDKSETQKQYEAIWDN